MATIKQLEKKIEQIKHKLVGLGDMHPGSLSKQWNVCGSSACKCKDLEDPQKHGPYYYLSFTHKKRSRTRFIMPKFVPQIEKQVNNYKLFKALTEEWKEVATELAKMKIEEQKLANNR